MPEGVKQRYIQTQSEYYLRSLNVVVEIVSEGLNV
jgi:hypothetical protein